MHVLTERFASSPSQVKSFVLSISKPRKIIILVKAGAPVDASIAALKEHMEVSPAFPKCRTAQQANLGVRLH